jgi:murein DD-endopeptidase MepM/ murein hydrolase activator NlpD
MKEYGRDAMDYGKKMKKGILLELLAMVILVGAAVQTEAYNKKSVSVTSDGYIKWVDFNVSYEALSLAYKMDVDTYGEPVHINWIELLAYAAAKSGGEFKSSALDDMENAKEKLVEEGVTMAELTKDLKYYSYYLEAYTAVLSGYVGEYEIETGEKDGEPIYEKCYGLKAFSPIAKGFEYRDYDDFGVARSFGYKREHLGHDMMGQIGTPIIAVESGYVEALGWNRYGGWRIGIRSFDKKRYYYYAHLRQNYPYAKWLAEGSEVQAGDVIGYMGHTGYSDTENVNNIDEVHLHFGIQLIFDESQKDGNTEIWINPYELTRFLCKNRSEVHKIEETKEWERTVHMKEEIEKEPEEK